MVGCVLSQLKPSELHILSCKKGLGRRPSASTLVTTKNVELLGPICNDKPTRQIQNIPTDCILFPLMMDHRQW